MIIYQVYPRSFLDTDADGVGDLNGITRKLSYIKSLGVEAVWISPFFKSPMKDFGYDVSSYREVDPLFGTMSDFEHLMKEAKRLSLGIIVDMVVSHTSNEHGWFQDSIQRKNNKEDWYLWANPNLDGTAPNNWLSVFGGSGWQWHPDRRQYYFHTFLDSQPDLNMHNEEVQAQILSDMQFWLEKGVSGFRLDACNHYFQDKQLRNNPPKLDTSQEFKPYAFQQHIYDQGRPEILPFLEKIRVLLDEYNAYSVAEVGGADPLGLMGEYTQEGRLHSAYSFAFMQPTSTASYAKNVIEKIEANIKAPSHACYALSNHDKPRVATRWLKGREHEAHAKEMLAFLFSMKGDICLYQGEELGLPEAEIALEDIQDPYGKTFWPKFKGRDGCRTPMPWTEEQFAGFSESKPWLPISEEHKRLNVYAQNGEKNSILNFSRHIISLRKKYPALCQGDIKFTILHESVLSFERTFETETILCVFNMENETVDISLSPTQEIIIAQNIETTVHNISLLPSGFFFAKTFRH